MSFAGVYVILGVILLIGTVKVGMGTYISYLCVISMNARL